VLAAIGRLPSTIEDRSIKVSLRRKRADEPIAPLRLDRADDLSELARKAARWAADHSAHLAVADPRMPPGIVNRAADNWRPLLAVADLAGGDWPTRARRAAVTPSASQDGESDRIVVLGDIWAAFDVRGVDRLSSDEVVAYLVGLEERRWAEYRRGKPITKTQIARLLQPFQISPGTIRLTGDRTPKGYYRAAFTDAVTRYLPNQNQNATPPQAAETLGGRADSKPPQGVGCGVSLENQNATPPQAAEPQGKAADFKTPHEVRCGVSDSRGEPQKSWGCGGVAFPAGGQPNCGGTECFSIFPSRTDFRLPRKTDEIDEERAAIAEFDGGLTRGAATLVAASDLDPDEPPDEVPTADWQAALDELITSDLEKRMIADD
jgi:hypothetical protein